MNLSISSVLQKINRGTQSETPLNLTSRSVMEESSPNRSDRAYLPNLGHFLF